MVDVTIASGASEDLHAAMQRLVPQLSSSNPPPSFGELDRVCRHEANSFFVASDETGIVGVLTLVMFPIPTGIRAWIEDVIVDDAARGKGVGRLLNEAAIEHAFSQGAVTVDLTSRPSREAANRLYQRIGFEARETNVYRYSKPEQPAGS
jgi:ribosomal protein S18 acetylase RimI-like enzyme